MYGDFHPRQVLPSVISPRINMQVYLIICTPTRTGLCRNVNPPRSTRTHTYRQSSFHDTYYYGESRPQLSCDNQRMPFTYTVTADTGRCPSCDGWLEHDHQLQLNAEPNQEHRIRLSGNPVKHWLDCHGQERRLLQLQGFKVSSIQDVSVISYSWLTWTIPQDVHIRRKCYVYLSFVATTQEIGLSTNIHFMFWCIIC